MNYLKHLKKYFIPGKHNTYKPHFFRAQAVLAMMGVIAFLFLIAISLNSLVIRSGSSQLGAVVSATLVSLANTDREKNDLRELSVNPLLEKAAQLKANDMAAKSYFSHNSPDGLTPWHWFAEAGYSFAFAGENLAVYFSDSAELEKAWMNSPAHRANILNSYFTEIGIATAKGIYQGKETVYVVQEFGRPKARIAAAIKKAQMPEVEILPAPAEISVLALEEAAANVKGAAAETEPLDVVTQDDTFIAVENTEDTAADTLDFIETSGEQKAEQKTLPPILFVAASPWTFLRTAYAGLTVCIAFALVLMIGIEIKRQHPLHIFYGVSLLALMGVLLSSWQGFFFGKLLVL